ncbi:hypothetical protein E2C01_084872 [Portunus trituberculatus]|uniref:Uncharacterized protein n=1 Tax=Portunus trituberculatus TaxID=210409 RepID=A0A5B7J5A3_PORTR|nr:hypothetical protein [Portunus trituberculatus]
MMQRQTDRQTDSRPGDGSRESYARQAKETPLLRLLPLQECGVPPSPPLAAPPPLLPPSTQHPRHHFYLTTPGPYRRVTLTCNFLEV